MNVAPRKSSQAVPRARGNSNANNTNTNSNSSLSSNNSGSSSAPATQTFTPTKPAQTSRERTTTPRASNMPGLVLDSDVEGNMEGNSQVWRYI